MKAFSNALLVALAFCLCAANAFAQDVVRLKNRWTGDYLHLENNSGRVELTKNLRAGGMWSAQWAAERP